MVSLNRSARALLFILCALFGLRMIYAQKQVWTEKQAYQLIMDEALERGHDLIITGEVAGPPRFQGRTQRLLLDNLAIDEKPFPGHLRLSAFRYPAHQAGNWLVVTLSSAEALRIKQSGFDSSWLIKQRVYLDLRQPLIKAIEQPASSSRWREWRSGVKKLSHRVRSYLEHAMERLLPEPQASLLLGMTFGIEREYPMAFYEKLRQAGVLHLVVASGYNLLVLGELMDKTAYLFGRRRMILLTILLYIFYALIAGFEPPILRALIVSSAALVAQIISRPTRPLLWWVYAALFLLIYNPLYLYSLSFQLSFAASLGLLLFPRRLEEYLAKANLPSFFRASLATTLAAQALTMPIIWLNFGQLYPRALLINTLVLPTVDPIMALGLITGVTSLVSSQLAQVISYPSMLILTYLIRVVQGLA